MMCKLVGWIIINNNWATEIRFIDSKEHWVRIIAEEVINKMLPIALRQEQFRIIIADNKVQLEVCHPTVVGESYKEAHVGICITNPCQHHRAFSDNNKDTCNINNKDNVNNNKVRQRKQSISINLYKETNHAIHSNKSNINKGHNVAKKIP